MLFFKTLHSPVHAIGVPVTSEERIRVPDAAKGLLGNSVLDGIRASTNYTLLCCDGCNLENLLWSRTNPNGESPSALHP